MSDSDSTTRTVASGLGRTVRLRIATLRVISGPETGVEARVQVPIFVIGSAAEADLRLSDGTVSREHVTLSLTAEGLHVRDDASKNGTWLGGVRVRDALITGDAVIGVGKSQIGVRIEPEPIDLEVSRGVTFGELIGVSLPMRHLFSLLARIAASDVTVLLEGESGVGKELVAKAIHAESSRKRAPFIALDCGAIPATLIESELFGHTRGAFTGATEARIGMFEAAATGSLFLDEIGELPLELQPKLLRALETKEIRPVGSHTTRPVDVRIIAATNRNFSEAVSSGAFREDLYYRLAVARVTVPPLRDRSDDILPIAGSFLRKALKDPEAEVPADLAGLLLAYHWPGNVRQLRNVIERYALLGAADAKALFDAPLRAAPGAEDDELMSLPYHEARAVVLERFERTYLERLLQRANGVIARAAELARIARPTLYRMLERVGASSGRDTEP